MSLATLKKKTKAYHKTMSVGQPTFSLQGTHRNQGWVGQSMISRSLPRTLFRGDTARGSGGSNGTYDDSTVVGESTTGENLNDAEIVKASSVGTSGMIATKYRWTRRPAPYISVSKADNVYTNTQEAYIRHIKNNNNQCVIDLVNSMDIKSLCSAITVVLDKCITCNDVSIKDYFKKNYVSLSNNTTNNIQKIIENNEFLLNRCSSLDKFIWKTTKMQELQQITSITTTDSGYTGNRFFNIPGGNLGKCDGIVYNTIENYNIWSFGTDSVTYTLTYTVTEPTTIYVLAIAGGGGGGLNYGGGGGGGGMVEKTLILPIGTNTISINVGKGGLTNTNGSNTTVIFNAVPANNITAIGGGHGGSWLYNIFPTTGGSGGGGAPNIGSGQLVPAINNMRHLGKSGTQGQGYAGGNGNYSISYGLYYTMHGGGGGGAGEVGSNYNVAKNINGVNYYGSGGNGKTCSLPGITNIYSTQYWGGGGGGCAYTTLPNTTANYDTLLTLTAGAGGIGGGGASGTDDYGKVLQYSNRAAPGVIADTTLTAVNSGTGYNPTAPLTSCQGGKHTGGGGGGFYIKDDNMYSNIPSTFAMGGSGIVIIAFK